MMTFFDFCIVGGGIVGFSTAMALQRIHPGAHILLLEKESSPGRHQTGHNSGVIHAGVYYVPGSLKARLCREGLVATKAFCREQGIAFNECGKLIVATNVVEHERIDALYQRALANGLQLQRIDEAELVRREPNVNGVAALYSPETAIVDYHLVCCKMAEQADRRGVVVRYDFRVDNIKECPSHVEIGSGREMFRAGQLIVCGGLQADRLARLAGLDVDFRIVPFRGEYFQLPQHKNVIINHLIYPAPDPELPFLGIHLTRMINGGVAVGPNAVIGFAREGYPKLSFCWRDSTDFLKFAGFWKLIYKHRRHALRELATSLSKQAYVKECRKYCPSLSVDDLRPYRAGIRAQIVNNDGFAVHDFLFMQTERMLHVCNTPSPAATSALPIGRMIAERCNAKNL